MGQHLACGKRNIQMNAKRYR